MRREHQNAKNESNITAFNRKQECYNHKAEEVGSNINKLYLVLDNYNLTGNKKKKISEGFSYEELAKNFGVL